MPLTFEILQKIAYAFVEIWIPRTTNTSQFLVATNKIQTFHPRSEEKNVSCISDSPKILERSLTNLWRPPDSSTNIEPEVDTKLKTDMLDGNKH